METYLFDLDGTLADSQAGLLQSFHAGLRAVGAPPQSDHELQRFLGASLPVMFRSVSPGIDDDSVAQGIAAFRRYYEREGIRQNTLYEGIAHMLAILRRHRRSAWLVTSKPKPYAVKVVSLLGIGAHLDGIIGAGLDETDTKTDLIARAMTASRAGFGTTLMLGDRSYDVTGALENNICPVGALWGYGSERELRDAGCTLFARTPRDFERRFILHPSPALASITR